MYCTALLSWRLWFSVHLLHFVLKASSKISIETEGGITIHKGKFLLRTYHEGPEGDQRYSCTLSLTLALDGVGGQRHAAAALPSGMTRYPLYRRLGRPQGRSGRVRKISPPPGLIPGPSSSQRVAIPTELSRPTELTYMQKHCLSVCLCMKYYILRNSNNSKPELTSCLVYEIPGRRFGYICVFLRRSLELNKDGPKFSISSVFFLIVRTPR